MQHVLCLQTSHSIVERISYWLGQELMDLWYWKEKTEATKAKFSTILGRVVDVTMVTKVIKAWQTTGLFQANYFSQTNSRHYCLHTGFASSHGELPYSLPPGLEWC